MNEILMKKVADSYEAVPPEFVWENIELSLNQNRKRRHFFLWLVAGIAFLSLSALVFYRDIYGIKDVAENDIKITGTNLGTTGIDHKFLPDENIIANNKSVQGKIESVIPLVEKKSRLYENENVEDKHEINEAIKEEKAFLNEVKEENSSPEMIIINSISKSFVVMQNSVFRPDFNDKIKCPSFGDPKKRMFAELGLLGGYHLKSIGNGSNEALAAIRNQSESGWYTWGLNGVFGINITPNFYIGTGIDWTQSKDKFKHSSDAITKMIITFDPVTGIPTDTSFVTGKLVSKGEIRYNSIDIPLIIGFVRKYDKWDFGVEMAPVFNLNFTANGKIFNDKKKISSIDKEPLVYKSGLGLGLKASFVIRRNISDGLSVQLKPTFKTYFNDINDSNYALPMRYNLFGINLGVRKDF
ncbi:MAG: hypothetical protein IPH57_13860 [Saprospiraceae bacterium]|nr:hypothetical protein [Saprospiraceae bacterium]